MKKLLLFSAIVLATATFIVGCSSSTPASKGEVKKYNMSEYATVGDVHWKLLEAKSLGDTLKAQDSRLYSPNYSMASDKKTTGNYVKIKVDVENKGSDMKTITTASIKLKDDQNREFTAASDVSEWLPEKENIFMLSNLNPNVPTSFSAIYEVAKDSKNLVAEVNDLSFIGANKAQISLGF